MAVPVDLLDPKRRAGKRMGINYPLVALAVLSAGLAIAVIGS